MDMQQDQLLALTLTLTPEETPLRTRSPEPSLPESFHVIRHTN